MTNTRATNECKQIIAKHSKSFSLASKLLPSRERERAVILYAWCRHVDDCIDECTGDMSEALATLRRELDDIYSARPLASSLHTAFRGVIKATQLPRHYPDELLAGMAMDASGFNYRTLQDLHLYCYRVAGVVGLMMSHALGVREPSALRNAVHMGIAMQLTNICRDVHEDWQRGRLYLPQTLLEDCGIGGLGSQLGDSLSQKHIPGLSQAVRSLLSHADSHYRMGDNGLRALHWRSALAVRSARQIYSAIGNQIEKAHHDVCSGRHYVSRRKKMALVGQSATVAIAKWPATLGKPRPRPPQHVLHFKDWHQGAPT